MASTRSREESLTAVLIKVGIFGSYQRYLALNDSLSIDAQHYRVKAAFDQPASRFDCKCTKALKRCGTHLRTSSLCEAHEEVS
jgi:hypothetical protein